MAKDPVCDMSVGSKIKTSHGGKTYYFCAEPCKNMFLKNPARFAKS